MTTPSDASQAVPHKAPHPDLQDALFVYAVGYDGAGAELIRGWPALVERVVSDVAGGPWDELLCDLDEWSMDGDDVPYHYSVNFEDGYMAIYRIGEDRAARAQAESKLPEGWVPCLITYEGDEPEEVAFGPQRMMDRLKKWLTSYFEHVYAERYPAARAQGAGEAVASSQDAEMLHDAREVIRIWNKRARKFGFDGVAGMLNAFRHGEAVSTAPTIPQAAEVPGFVPEGFWLAPMHLDDADVRLVAGQQIRFGWADLRDSWLARHAAPKS